MKNEYLALLLLLCFMACERQDSALIEEQKTWIEVYGRYLDADQLYKVEVTLLQGDTLPFAKPFALDGSIQVQEKIIEARKLSEQLVRYQADFKGDFNGQLQLKFADAAIHFKQIDLSYKTVPDFQLTGDTLSKSKGGLILFQDSFQLELGEQLLILMNDAQKQTASLELEGPLKIKQLAIPADYLGNLGNFGNGNLYLITKKRAVFEQKKQKLSYLLEHYSSEQEIRFID